MMQTFLPYPDFVISAKSLDNARLGKQRVEVLQILKTLNGEYEKAWKNHPAVKMWRGYEFSLIQYGKAICIEWLTRGFKDSCYGKIESYLKPDMDKSNPPWLGDKAFHLSHRSCLIRKDSKHYQFADTPNNLNCMWPVK